MATSIKEDLQRNKKKDKAKERKRNRLCSGKVYAVHLFVLVSSVKILSTTSRETALSARAEKNQTHKHSPKKRAKY